MLNQFTGTPTENDCQSMCAILAKHFIYCCKMKNCLPGSFKQKLKSYCSVELYAKSMYSEKKTCKSTARWSLMKKIFNSETQNESGHGRSCLRGCRLGETEINLLNLNSPFWGMNDGNSSPLVGMLSIY